jgi:hypothetical protein
LGQGGSIPPAALPLCRKEVNMADDKSYEVKPNSTPYPRKQQRTDAAVQHDAWKKAVTKVAKRDK